METSGEDYPKGTTPEASGYPEQSQVNDELEDIQKKGKLRRLVDKISGAEVKKQNARIDKLFETFCRPENGNITVNLPIPVGIEHPPHAESVMITQQIKEITKAENSSVLPVPEGAPERTATIVMVRFLDRGRNIVTEANKDGSTRELGYDIITKPPELYVSRYGGTVSEGRNIYESISKQRSAKDLHAIRDASPRRLSDLELLAETFIANDGYSG